MAQATEKRISRLEGAFEQMNERLGGMESNIASLREEISGLRQDISGINTSLRQDMNTSMAELRHEMHTDFRWTMGTIVVMWVTVICAIMFA